MRSESIILGRAEIAHRLNRSERTISRWIACGLLHVSKAGPFENSLLKINRSELEQLKSMTDVEYEGQA